MTDEEEQIFNEFTLEFNVCWACGFEGQYGEEGVGLEVHHIQKHQRIHERWNLSRLCMLCHRSAEGDTVIRRDPYGSRIPYPILHKSMVLWLKARWDPVWFLEARLEKQKRVLKLPQRRRPWPEYEQLYWRNTNKVYPGDDIRRMLEW